MADWIGIRDAVPGRVRAVRLAPPRFSFVGSPTLPATVIPWPVTLGTHAAAILELLTSEPDLSTEQIRQTLDLVPPVVKAALRELRAAGRVRSRGQRRATRWRVA